MNNKYVEIDQNGQAIMPEMGQDRFTWQQDIPVCNNGIHLSQKEVQEKIQEKENETKNTRIAQWQKIAIAAHYATAIAIKNKDWNTKKQMRKIMEDAKTYSNRMLGGIFETTPPDPMKENNVIKILLNTEVSKQDQAWARAILEKDQESYLAWKKSQRK